MAGYIKRWRIEDNGITRFLSYWYVLEPSSILISSPDGKEERIYVLKDNQGFILTKEEFYKEKESIIDFFEKAEKAYNDPEIYSFLIWLNTASRLYRDGFRMNENDKFVIPEPNIKYKEFDPNKRKWSFKCSWCGKKVSSDKQKYYYSILFNKTLYHFPALECEPCERACSKECATHVWHDVYKNWIHENGLEDYFEL